METTYAHTYTKPEKTTRTKISNEGQISKKALVTFIYGALIVFASAIYYCISTGHAAEGGVLAIAFTLIALFAASTYKSFK
ncbi:MAG: hypothetical protein ABIQ40_01645 [Bacteroidia bacterium]